MNQKHFPIAALFALALLVLLAGCAQVVAPSGGARDEQPPRLDSLHSTANYQTHFEKQDILLIFDEFIQLHDPYNQIVISPPLSKRPEVKVEKYRRIRLRFDDEEELHPNTTYTIYFGEAIKDFTEGNAADLRFVFSTGDHIDSLAAEGRVVDAVTGQGVPDVLVMLYEAAGWEDSIPSRDLPLYFARTDEQGAYRLENLRRDSFRLFALKDANGNYRFDQSAELIAFSDSLVVSGRDSTGVESLPPLRLFAQEQPLLLLDRIQPRYGLLKLLFNRPPYELSESSFEPASAFICRKAEQDSLLLWYHSSDTAALQVILSGGDFSDTVSLQPKGRAEFLSDHSLGFRQTLPAVQEAPARGKTDAQGSRPAAVPLVRVQKQLPETPIVLEFDTPLKGFRDSLFLWERDSLPLASSRLISIDSADCRNLHIEHPWQEGSVYRLQLLPGAVEDVYGGRLQDTTRFAWRIEKRENLSSLHLKLSFPDAAQTYVLQLKQGGELLWEQSVSGVEEWEHRFAVLEPGKYKVVVIEDRNGNDRYDTGDYWKHRQPERLAEKVPEELRPNWEVEVVWKVEF